MWLKIITPTKGVMIRQWLMQLFGEASRWASLVDVSELLAPRSSELHNSAWTEYKSGSQPMADIPLKDLAIWLGKQVGVTLTRAVLRTDPHGNPIWNWDVAGASRGDANIP